jgi:DNA processing protein
MPPMQELRGGRLPARLADLATAPAVLYLHGELPRGPVVAIVGTRRPTPAAAAYARELAGELGVAGVAIISGGAAGIDTAAHQGALDVGAPTVVVAPSGFERPYPPQNAELFRQVVRSGGAFLATTAAQTVATLPRFFERNGVLVALSHAVIVVEAPLRSGARNAAKFARRLGRPLFAVPTQPWNSNGQGCVAELQLGANPLASHRDVLRLLGRMRLHAVALPPTRAARVVRMGSSAICNFDQVERGTAQSHSPNWDPRTADEPCWSTLRPGSEGSGQNPDAGRSGLSRQQRDPVPAPPPPTAHAAPRPEPGSCKRRGRAASRPRASSTTLLLTGGQSESAGAGSSIVLDAVRAGATHADQVCAQTGLEAARVAQLLLALTLDGRLASDRAGRLRILCE